MKLELLTLFLAMALVGLSCMILVEAKGIKANLVMLPDGHGFYVKNDELTQEMLNIVPVGMNIMVYGTIQVKESLTGKGLKNSTITVNEGSHFVHPMKAGER